MKKFEKLVHKTDKKMGNNKEIDFKKSDINYISEKLSKKKRTNKIQFHLNDNEFKIFIDTLKPGELKADRVRNLVFKDIKKRLGNKV